MIRIGIVEDDPASAQLLVDYLERYRTEHDESFDVRVFADGSQIVRGYRPDFDILLLDVEMPGLDGFATAERIRAVDRDVVIVFITNMAQYAIRGYEVDALSYVLKPVAYFAFSQEIRRSLERIRQRSSEYLLLPVEGGVARVDVADVVFAESMKHRIVVHTTTERYGMTGALKTLEAQLTPHGFFRSNSCYLVNLRHVQGVRQNSCQLVGGHDLVISRPRKKAFLAALTDYLGGRTW
ncbi:LytTR family DNA-binding domain-containing protein [Cellulomonas sp. NPDC089187]|uniref:LytR/AlgR family response regulator transcription factor n=1 Tax=Cellulomonas sp. NPDC089187 TaxID=3154970 RepID=UPI00341BC1F3